MAYTHTDVDIGIRRRDVATLVAHLGSSASGGDGAWDDEAWGDGAWGDGAWGDGEWEVSIAAAGRLHAWDGRELEAARHENNLWCRRAGGPWLLDVLIGDGDDHEWVYRRDPTFRLPWTWAVHHDAAGLPYLAPGLQLLFKSVAPRPRDDLDAREVVPSLAAEQIALLGVRLPRDHVWQHLLAAHRRPFGVGDVVEVMDLLDGASVPAWVDGGWAVDALLGEPTRPHDDLDLAVPTRAFTAALAALGAAGFVQVRDDGPHNRVLLDRMGRLVDLHAFDDSTTVVGEDGVSRCGPDGLAYEAGGFAGRGVVGDRRLACISPETLVCHHTGDVVDDDDWHDVRLLHQRFGVPIPPDDDPRR